MHFNRDKHFKVPWIYNKNKTIWDIIIVFNTANSELSESYKDVKLRTSQINYLVTIRDSIQSLVIATTDTIYLWITTNSGINKACLPVPSLFFPPSSPLSLIYTHHKMTTFDAEQWIIMEDTEKCQKSRFKLTLSQIMCTFSEYSL